jgi:hypothetical protein
MPKHPIGNRNRVVAAARLDDPILNDKIYSMKLVFDEFPGIDSKLNRDDAINTLGRSA